MAPSMRIGGIPSTAASVLRWLRTSPRGTTARFRVMGLGSMRAQWLSIDCAVRVRLHVRRICAMPDLRPGPCFVLCSPLLVARGPYRFFQRAYFSASGPVLPYDAVLLVVAQGTAPRRTPLNARVGHVPLSVRSAPECAAPRLSFLLPPRVRAACPWLARSLPERHPHAFPARILWNGKMQARLAGGGAVWGAFPRLYLAIRIMTAI
ncbi:hypothetical protein B0H10DRAFT_2209426 [Mycena sp. CBHHK59/15]|nr:hypothetical protein B0H10DRAFT_2209426 [Mycena sp. CBHHK59/15]